jgi:hypothetical protein
MSADDARLDRYLSGELPLDGLPEPLAREEARLRELLETARATAPAPPSLRDAVMREIALIPSPLWRRLLDWSVRPHTIRLSPAAGALALAASAAVFALWPGVPPTPAPSAGAPGVVTRFVLVAPGASSVHVTGDFASWLPEAVALEDLRGTGIWTADIQLPPGVYQYTFIVNGSEWRPDPRALSQVDDGFGQVNSVVIVPAESDA